MSTITIGYTDVPGFPAGTAVDHYRLRVVGLVTPETSQPVTGTSVDYTFPGPDTYTVGVAGVGATGTVLGTEVTTTFVVAAPVTVTLSLPSSVTVA